MPVFSVPGTFTRDEVVKTIATNRTGSACSIGDIVAFDLDASDADTPAFADNPRGIFSNVVTPATKHLSGGMFGVVVGLGGAGTGADNTDLLVGLKGVFPCAIVGNATAYQINDTVSPANTKSTLTKGTDGVVVLGMLLEAAATSDKVCNVLFNGDVRNGAAGSASA